MPGPVPKRVAHRRHHGKVVVDRVPAGTVVEPPALDLEDVHPLAAAMYSALGRSGQTIYMEPSDWEYARWTAWVMSKAAQKPTAMMILAVDKMLSNLMICEADRRRARVELERSQVEEEPAPSLSLMADIAVRRARLTIKD